MNKKNLRVACVQVNASSDWKKNLQSIRKQVEKAAAAKVQLIALPENFCWRGQAKQLSYIANQITPLVLQEFKILARRFRLTFLLGSLIEPSKQKRRYFNTSFLISSEGRIIAKYRKIHLFDISLRNKVVTQESRYIAPGRHITIGKVRNIPVGLTICYDLRFPELFRRLVGLGSEIIFVPSNFTETTGRAHWEILLRARAIENQVFIVAPAQVGKHPANQIQSFGTSLVIDPWGRILARGDRRKEGVLIALLKMDFLRKLRRSFPVLGHRRVRS